MQVSKTRRTADRFSWILMLATGIGILGFGVVVVLAPQIVPGYSGPTEEALLRTVGVATVGMGVFGLAITFTAFRKQERWAWYALWFYPIFWASHLAGLGVRPGADDVVFILVSLVGLALPVRSFFPKKPA